MEKVLNLNTIKKSYRSTKNKKRLGRGVGTGHGKTAGKGHKGQYARKSSDLGLGFEGGQMPIYRRVPKSGFTSAREKPYTLYPSNLGNLKGDSVDLELLQKEFGHSYTTFKIILKKTENSKKSAKPKQIKLGEHLKISEGAKTYLESLSWTFV